MLESLIKELEKAQAAQELIKFVYVALVVRTPSYLDEALDKVQEYKEQYESKTT